MKRTPRKNALHVYTAIYLLKKGFPKVNRTYHATYRDIIDRFHCHAVKKIIRKPFGGQRQEIVILLKINKEDTSPSFRSVRSPKLQIFVEMFRRNLQSSVWKRHVGAHQMCTNMAAGK